MPATFSRTLRSLEADDTRRRGIALLAGVLSILWASWFLAAEARLEVEAAARPVAAQVDGRILATNLAIRRDFRAGEVLVILDVEPERLALQERRTHRDGLVAQLEARGNQTAAEPEVAATYRAARTVAIGCRSHRSTAPQPPRTPDWPGGTPPLFRRPRRSAGRIASLAGGKCW